MGVSRFVGRTPDSYRRHTNTASVNLWRLSADRAAHPLVRPPADTSWLLRAALRGRRRGVIAIDGGGEVPQPGEVVAAQPAMVLDA